jgi:hypothetical protein
MKPIHISICAGNCEGWKPYIGSLLVNHCDDTSLYEGFEIRDRGQLISSIPGEKYMVHVTPIKPYVVWSVCQKLTS